MHELSGELMDAKQEAAAANAVADACGAAEVDADAIAGAALSRQRAQQDARNRKALELIQRKVHLDHRAWTPPHCDSASRLHMIQRFAPTPDPEASAT